MRLWMKDSTASDRSIVLAILAAEQHLAQLGVTQSECLAAAVTGTGRACHRGAAQAFGEAERVANAALCRIEPAAKAGVLVLVATPGDEIPPPATTARKPRTTDGRNHKTKTENRETP